MAETALMSELVSAARLHCDQRSDGGFISSTEAYLLTNRSIEMLRAEIIAARGQNPFTETTTFATVVNQSEYSLPTNHSETCALIIRWGTQSHEEVEPLAIEDYPRLTAYGSWSECGAKGYHIKDRSNLTLMPTPSSAVTVEHIYYAGHQDFTQSDTVDLVFEGWREAVELDTACRMLEIQELDSSVLEKRRDRAIATVIRNAENRANREVLHVYDMAPEENYNIRSAKWWPDYRG